MALHASTPSVRVPVRPAFSILALAASAAVAGCGEGGEPTGPPAVATVSLMSPIDDVMAVSRTVQLSAVARDASGTPIGGTSFTWQSSDPSVATVDGAGVVEGLKAGTATISATTDGVTGSLGMRVVDADLAAISALLADAYTDVLVAGLGDAEEARVVSTLSACTAALDQGHILDLGACLEDIPDDAASDPTDRALLAVLAVISARAALFLSL